MKRIQAYKVVEETEEEQYANRHFNPALLLEYQGQRLPLGIGSSDDLTVYRSKNVLLAISHNSRLDYLGARSYNLNDGKWEPISEVFFQHDYEVAELKERLGLKEIDTDNPKLAKELMEYLY